MPHGTFLHVLKAQAEELPDHPAVTLVDGANLDVLTTGELWRLALAARTALARRGAGPGASVMIAVTRTNRAYLAALLGSMLAGAKPSGIGLTRPGQVAEALRVAQVVKPACIIGTAELVAAGRSLGRDLPPLVDGEELLSGEPEPVQGLPAPDSVGYVQLSSGTTGSPKAIVLSHRAIMANLEAIRRTFYWDEARVRDARLLSWLPLFHDMGLFGGLLSAVYSRIPSMLVDPAAFALDPLSWLRQLTTYKITYAVAPTFAYNFCIRMLKRTRAEGIDLRCLRTALIGAEPITVETLRSTLEHLAPLGLGPDVLSPVYGLAESTVLATGTVGRAPRLDFVDQEALETSGIAKPRPESEGGRGYVSNGRPVFETSLRIVGADGVVLEERHVGRVEVSSTSLTDGWHTDAGYRAREEDWLDTGDVGYLADGELYLTGRTKDIIIRRGRNIAPYAMEEIAVQVAGVRAGRVAAFGLFDRAQATEKIVVVAERHSNEAVSESQIVADIRASLGRAGYPVDAVWVAPPGTIQKTTSGKLRRGALRDLYVANGPHESREVRGERPREGIDAS
jgi:acyl-CoA synthetase (AMP-forming)/AMP-acid ligase II